MCIRVHTYFGVVLIAGHYVLLAPDATQRLLSRPKSRACRSGVCWISSIYERSRSGAGFPPPAPVNLDLKGTFCRSRDRSWRFAGAEMLAWIIGGKLFPAVWPFGKRDETRRAESLFRRCRQIRYERYARRCLSIARSCGSGFLFFRLSDCREAFIRLLLIAKSSSLAREWPSRKRETNGQREKGGRDDDDSFQEYSKEICTIAGKQNAPRRNSCCVRNARFLHPRRSRFLPISDRSLARSLARGLDLAAISSRCCAGRGRPSAVFRGGRGYAAPGGN